MYYLYKLIIQHLKTKIKYYEMKNDLLELQLTKAKKEIKSKQVVEKIDKDYILKNAIFLNGKYNLVHPKTLKELSFSLQQLNNWNEIIEKEINE